MSYYGYAGHLLYVDLTRGTIRKEPLPEEWVRDYIGGLGISSRLVYDLVPTGVDPFSPQNTLVIGAGPLLGTLASAAARADAVSKSPLSGFLGTANAGFSMVPMMKYAGYDHLIITGQAEKPVYIKVFDDDVEVRDAAHLWGKTTWDTVDALRRELGDCWVGCIGPGGEKLVRYAGIQGNKHSNFSKTGLGAVMGSKRLKAVAARGTKGIAIADRKGFKKLVDELQERMASPRAVSLWRAYGMSVGRLSSPDANEGGYSVADFRDRVARRVYACLACPVGCKHVINRGDGTAFKVTSLGSLIGWHNAARIENWDELQRCVEMENKYGVDGGSVAGVLDLAVELYQRGILSDADLGGWRPRYGGQALRELLDLIIARKGIGDLLAEGVKRAAERIGKGSEKLAKHIKGVEREPDLKSFMGTENLGGATNPRGGHLDRAVSMTFMPGRSRESYLRYARGIGVPENRVEAVCRGPENYNVSRLTRWVEDFNTITTCMGFCDRAPVGQHLNLEVVTELYNAATGLDRTPEEMRTAGERIWNLQKCFNVREGASRRDDVPNTLDPDAPLIVRGEIDYGTLNQLLDEYYQEREWEVSTGTPIFDKLASLGLAREAAELRSGGLI